MGTTGAIQTRSQPGYGEYPGCSEPYGAVAVPPPNFKQQANAAIADAGPGLKWFVPDALPLTQLDVTGHYELADLEQTLRAQGAELVIAGRQTEMRNWRTDRGLPETEQGIRHFPTLRKAVGAYRAMLAAGNSSAAFAGGSQSSATPGPAVSPGAGSETS